MQILKLSAAAVALAVMLLAANSAQAVIMIDAYEVGGNVVFTLSGSLDTQSLNQITANNDPSRFTNDIVAPLFGSFGPPGVAGSFITFGSPLPIAGYNEAILANLTGPIGYGPRLVGSSQPSNNSGSIFQFYTNFSGGLRFGRISFPSSYFSSSSISASMSFTGTFASLGMTPGIYQWDWFNSSTNVHESLVFQFGVPETGSTVMLMAIGLAGLGWLRRKIPERMA